MDWAQQDYDDAWREWDAAYNNYWEAQNQLYDAEDQFFASNYDPDYDYVDYLDWEKPDDFDDVIEYLEDCDQDADQEECWNACYDNPDEEYAWCTTIDECRKEEECCINDCYANDD